MLNLICILNSVSMPLFPCFFPCCFLCFFLPLKFLFIIFLSIIRAAFLPWCTPLKNIPSYLLCLSKTLLLSTGLLPKQLFPNKVWQNSLLCFVAHESHNFFFLIWSFPFFPPTALPAHIAFILYFHLPSSSCVKFKDPKKLRVLKQIVYWRKLRCLS